MVKTDFVDREQAVNISNGKGAGSNVEMISAVPTSNNGKVNVHLDESKENSQEEDCGPCAGLEGMALQRCETVLDQEKKRSENAMDLFAKEFSNDNENAVCTFRDMRFSVDLGKKGLFKRGKSKVKHIIKGVSGQVKAGEVLAILGPSGAGKTTLLNMLTLQDKGGVATGTICLNGQPLTRDLFLRSCYFMPQYEHSWAFLTCRETLLYASELYHPGNAEEAAKRVDLLLEVVGLSSVADTKVGNAFFAGLSGGQKKRLSIAVALVAKPLVLFMDEPTSGLDAAAAASIMAFVNTLAERSRIMIVATIHQPSASVFEGFNKVMLLSKGRTAYSGPSDGVDAHFAALGHHRPGDANTAEFMLDVVNDEFTEPASVARILDSWSEHEAKTLAPNRKCEPVPGQEGNEERALYNTSLLEQTRILLRRQGLLTLRDPSLYSGRAIMYFIMVAFFCIMYLAIRDLNQSQVNPRVNLLMWIVGPPMSLGLVAVYSFNSEMMAIKKEVQNGMVRPMAYLMASTAIQMPVMLLAVCIGWLIPMYAIAGFAPESLVLFILMVTLTLLSLENVAQFFAAYFSNFLLGMMSFLNVWFMAFLFCGIMLALDDIIWPFRLFAYVMPLRYTLRALAYLEFKEQTFEGAVPSAGGGFTCPNDQTGGLECFGYDGKTVLDSLSLRYESISSENTLALDFGVVVAFIVVFKFLYAWMLVKQTSAHMVPGDAKGTQNEFQAVATAPAKDEDKQENDKAQDNENKDLEDPEHDAHEEMGNRFLQNIFSNSGGGATLSFENICWDVKTKKDGVKHILKNITGTVKSGEVLAILGPSGSGKTVLLNTLTLEHTVGLPSGIVTLNGQTMDHQLLVRTCYSMPQSDNLRAFLTARETLEYAWKLYHPNEKDIPKSVQTLLDVVGLGAAADTKVGNAFFQGLSGGQKRRLSLAIAIAARPKVLFLDEPTSGLDEAAATGVMSFITRLAKASKCPIVCIIHQPSARVFNSFDKVLLLSNGRTAFIGKSQDVLPYFKSAGHEKPANANTAEFMLDLVNSEFTDPEAVDRLLDHWEEKGAKDHADQQPVAAKETGEIETEPRAGFFTQIVTLVKRQSRLVVRDPTLYTGRTIMFIVMLTFFGAVYWEAHEYVQTQVQARLFFCMWVVGVPSCLAVIAVYATHSEMMAIKKEVQNGMVNPLAYITGTAFMQVPLIAAMTVVGFSLTLYGMMGFVPGQYLLMMIISAATLYCFEAMAQLMAVLFGNFLMGMLSFLMMWFASFLFAGFFLREEDVVWPFRALVPVLPLRYAISGTIWVEFSEATFEGARRVSDGSGGFTNVCDGGSPLQCFGRDGKDVLDSLGVTFGIITSDLDFGETVGIILGIAMVFKLLYAVILYIKTTRYSAPKAQAK